MVAPGGDFVDVGRKGMTLRDWFAGQALAGSDWSAWEPRPGLSQDIADKCYAKADAMIAERKKGRR